MLAKSKSDELMPSGGSSLETVIVKCDFQHAKKKPEYMGLISNESQSILMAYLEGIGQLRKVTKRRMPPIGLFYCALVTKEMNSSKAFFFNY